MRSLTIAVDGFSGCGKSTIAKDLAKALNYVFIDSGAMYRGVTFYALQNAWISENHLNREELIAHLKNIEIAFNLQSDSSGKQHLILNGIDVEQEIRSLHVSNFVSRIAAISEVRRKLVDLQRNMGKLGGVVMDGRDIGSVVFPHADLKFFVNASSETRALRRQKELKVKGESHSLEDILKNLEERDAMDTSRADSPLIQTDDAIVIDTTNHTRESQLNFALACVHEVLENAN